MNRPFKYIFMTGAPGSRWSGVAKAIWQSPSIDSTDGDVTQSYNNTKVSHTGAYFGPEMQFGNDLDKPMVIKTKEVWEKEFDKPFSDSGVKLIKSHHFAYNLDFITNTWPECPLIIVQKTNDECFSWWIRAGGFNITYPKYSWYLDNDTMYEEICKQNEAINKFLYGRGHYIVNDVHQMMDLIGLSKQDHNIEFKHTNVKLVCK